MEKYEFISIIFTLTFIVSLSVSVLIIPIINKIGKDFKILDFPDKRKHHLLPLVRLGGIGILLGYSTYLTNCQLGKRIVEKGEIHLARYILIFDF